MSETRTGKHQNPEDTISDHTKTMGTRVKEEGVFSSESLGVMPNTTSVMLATQSDNNSNIEKDLNRKYSRYSRGK
jgi:hypothetical protein